MSTLAQRLGSHSRRWWLQRGVGVLAGLIIVFYPSIFSNSPTFFQNSGGW